MAAPRKPNPNTKMNSESRISGKQISISKSIRFIFCFSKKHLNALFDLCSKRYVDAVIQPSRKKNESLAMTQMIERYSGGKKTIFIADRGYETYNIFAHVQEKDMYYLIRVKDGGSGSMAGSFRLPEKEEFDRTMHLLLTRKQMK